MASSELSSPDFGFDYETVELGLRCIVLSGGNTARAERKMLAHGTPVDKRTLRTWMEETHAARYEQLLAEIRAELDTSIADTSKALADEFQEIEMDMARELKDKLVDMEGRDLARSIQALAQAGATHIQTERLLTDKPTSIHEIRAPGEILADLRDLGVVDAEVVEES